LPIVDEIPDMDESALATPALQPAPPARALDEMAEAIGRACAGLPGLVPQRVGQALRRYADAGILQPRHCAGSAQGYVRHVLHADPRGRFAVAALVWLQGQHSPVHAHETWCAYRVVRGALQEERYRWDAQACRAVRAGVVARMCGDTGWGAAGYGQIHRLGNAGPQPAISIHVYGVPAQRLATHVNRLVAAA